MRGEAERLYASYVKYCDSIDVAAPGFEDWLRIYKWGSWNMQDGTVVTNRKPKVAPNLFAPK